MQTYNTYTTADLISNITLTGHVPIANSTFTPQNIVTLANRELQTSIVKQLLSSRGAYYKTYVDMAVVQNGLYPIPTDCIAGALANVELIQSVTILQVMPLEESEQFSTNSPTSTTYGYFLQGNFIQILPTPPVGNLRLWYFKRPSQLVTVDNACLVTAVDVTGTLLTVASIPSTIGSGAYVDLVGDQPPFNVVGTQTIQSIVLNVITLDAAPTIPVIPGNYVCLYQQTCVPQIPVEFRILLEQRTICSIYEIQGAGSKLKAAQEKLKEIEKDTLQLITNRVKSQTAIISAFNGGFLSGRGNSKSFFQATGKNG